MEEEYIRDYLTTTVPCGHCGQQYVGTNIELVKQTGGYYTFSVYCQYCNRQNFVTVFVNKGEVLEPEVELTDEEIEKFCTPLCPDDVLDMHTFLTDFDGDFCALFPDIRLDVTNKPEAGSKLETEPPESCHNEPDHIEGEEA